MSHAKAVVWNCTYLQYHALHERTLRSTNSPFKMTFHFDTQTGGAFLVGNNGVAELNGHWGRESISFMEKLPTGSVQTTTINLRDGKSVHSRHSSIGPSQYYGTCMQR